MDETENPINDLEHKEAKNNQSEQQENRIPKNEDSVSIPWDKFKHSSIHIIGVLEGVHKKQQIRNLFKK